MKNSNSMRMMWICVALIGVVAIVVVSGASAGYLLFVVPCVLMMGAMVLMMSRGMGSGDGDR